MSSSDHYYNAMPMPFWSRARIEIVNPTARAFGLVLWEILRADNPWPRGRAGLFHAEARREWPTTRSRDYTILDAQGRGSFIGYALAIQPFAPANKCWWEGDQRMFVDGRRTPTIQGTGHEDEHLGGWSNEFLLRPFSLPLHGEPAVGPLTDVGGQFNGDCSLYRFHVPIPFETGIRHGCEHGIGNQENYRYSSCAFYYLAPAVRMVQADAVDFGDGASEEAHRFRAEGEDKGKGKGKAFAMESTFEGDEGQKPQKVSGRIFQGPFEFTAKVPAANGGLRLRALFDQAEGNRLLEVEVGEGGPPIPWLRAGANPHRRLREEDLEIPPERTAGKTEARIRVRPVNGPVAECRWTVLVYGPAFTFPAAPGPPPR
jgi:hypothetical protein